MSKNIVVCSDGTGNTAIKDRGTNVFKLFEAVDVNGHRTDPSLTPQLAIYDDGVGTETFKPLKIFAGATGYGLSRNVRQLYKELCRLYDPGDQIFLFGFSRGAFTVRTLAGFIHQCGILNMTQFQSADDLEAAVEGAYRAYRKSYRTELAKLFLGEPKHTAAEGFKMRHCLPGDVRIRFVGVWDTVDAVGTPFHISDFINVAIRRYKFPDLKLNNSVDYARHAVSIDDQRHTFHPLLWENDPDRIDQVWFAGVHSNVGGGYPKQGMSLVTLDWMLKQAADKGLRVLSIDSRVFEEHANVDDKLYNSRAGAGMFYRWLPRDMEKMCGSAGIEAKIHVSVLERIAHGTEDYAPGTLAPAANIVATPTGDPARDDAAEKRARVVERIFRAAHADRRPLLARVRVAVRIGWFSYYIYLFSCLGMALVAAMQGDRGLTINPWLILKNTFHLVNNILSGEFDAVLGTLSRLALAPEAWLLAGGVGTSYIISKLADGRLSGVFSEFWHGQQPNLRSAFKNVHDEAAAQAESAHADAAHPE